MFFDRAKSCPLRKISATFKPLFFQHVRKIKDLLFKTKCVHSSKVDTNQRTLFFPLTKRKETFVSRLHGTNKQYTADGLPFKMLKK